MAFHDRRLGENLRRIRLNAHMTQKALTEQIGYQSPEHWSRIESGCRHIPLHMLDRFCKLLDVSYEEVLHGATEARIRSDTKPEQTRSYEERSLRIVRRTSWKASCRSANKSRIFPGCESK